MFLRPPRIFIEEALAVKKRDQLGTREILIENTQKPPREF